MKYSNGSKIRVGDRVKIGNGDTGVVVACLFSDEYSVGYPRNEWEYLKEGVLLRTDHGALVHLDEMFEDDFLVRIDKGTENS